MQVTLKRASEYARALGEAANKITLNTTATVSHHGAEAATVHIEHGAVRGHVALSNLVDSARRKLIDDHQRALSLLDAQYEIRKLIGSTNHSSGIAETLTERARLDASIKHLEKLAGSASSDRPETSEDVARQIVRHRETPADRISYRLVDGVVVNLATPDFTTAVREEIARRKRDRMDIQDRLGGLNLNTKVTLPEHVVEMLKSHGIMA